MNANLVFGLIICIILELSLCKKADYFPSFLSMFSKIEKKAKLLSLSDIDLPLGGGHFQGIKLFSDYPKSETGFLLISHDSSTLPFVMISKYNHTSHSLCCAEYAILASDGREPPLRHIGGIDLITETSKRTGQTYGILAAGLEDNQDKLRSEVRFYKMDSNRNEYNENAEISIEEIEKLRIYREGEETKRFTAGAAAIVKVHEDNPYYLAAVLDWDAENVDFYWTGYCDDFTQCEHFQFIATWNHKDKLTQQEQSNASWGSYQNFNMFYGRDESDGRDKVFILTTLTSYSIFDYAHLFALQINKGPGQLQDGQLWDIDIHKKDSKKINMKNGAHFIYAGGFFTKQFSELITLGTQRNPEDGVLQIYVSQYP